LKRNEGTLHGFNNYKGMANLDLATLIEIFPSRILELLGHYILDEVAQ
jgi:hypothetical protein